MENGRNSPTPPKKIKWKKKLGDPQKLIFLISA